jgi:anti-sigma regulatory factor (Ser/Thr protein kinase)
LGKDGEVPQLRGDPSVEFSAVLEPVPTAARAARRFVSGIVAMVGLMRLQQTATLVVSELVTNAIQHGQGHVVLRVRVSPTGALLVEVSDAGGQHPVEERPGPDVEHGRGLWIVGLVSESWGVAPQDGGGKTVWAELTH